MPPRERLNTDTAAESFEPAAAPPLRDQADFTAATRQPPGAVPANVPRRTVWLRNDSPGIRVVHDVDGKAHTLAPSKAVEVTLPKHIIDLIEQEVVIQAGHSFYGVLRVVSKSDALRSVEGRPEPTLMPSQQQERMLELAAAAEDMDFLELTNTAKTVLGDRFPRGRPSRDDIINTLQRYGRGAEAA